MKRLHVHITVDDLARAIGFYSVLLGAEPTKVKPDYAKWMLEDPRINLAVSTRSSRTGLDHLGIQVTEEAEANAVVERLDEAQAETMPELATTCCYARSDKHWVTDPAGIPWEIYRTLEDAEIYGPERRQPATEQSGACCAPASMTGGQS
jgi:catechol 2,3-dioxygenase-like lactoylglutathione lyase family enzyme